jgi:hypothetical protein
MLRRKWLVLVPVVLISGLAAAIALATQPGEPAWLREHDGARWVVLADGSVRGTFVLTRPPKCRFVLVTSSNGTQQWVSVC